MKLYLDASCLNRPFDDRRQARIRLESEAVTLIFEQFDAGRWEHVSSEMAEIEIAAITEPERRRRVVALLPDCEDRIRLTGRIFRRPQSWSSMVLPRRMPRTLRLPRRQRRTCF